MIIYSDLKTSFIDDVLNGEITDKIEAMMFDKMHKHVSHNEIRSWENSLSRMSNVLNTPDIPDDVFISLEYNIPHTAKRVDLIITGSSDNETMSAVIIELKQWESAEYVPDKDAIVRTYLNGSNREVTHPSYQAWSYAKMIEDFNEQVQNGEVTLHPCAYLHNYKNKDPEPLSNKAYESHFTRAPLFLQRDAGKLREFITKFIKSGYLGKETVYLIDSGRLKPSKSLQDSLGSMLKGNEEFVMIDTQKVIYEHILECAKDIEDKKKVIIVDGGPGTGKSVLAVNLLVKLTSMGLATSYITKNAAPREVYSAKLKGSLRKNRIDMLFKGSGCFYSAPKNTFDVLLADEAHRLNEKSGMFQNVGENQIMEIIRASRMSVFFIDEAQRVTMKDIGSIETIRRFAEQEDASVDLLTLDSQFRCDGSDGFMAWLDNLLGIRETANIDIVSEDKYDFKVFDDPSELRREIEDKNKICGKSRLVAGYCWNWITKNDFSEDVFDITIPETDFAMKWNLSNDKTWAISEGSVDQVGCIHTCQGLEFDYVGVIIGDDLRFDGKEIVTDYTKRAKTDKALNGLKSKYKTEEERQDAASEIIRNTYRVLMTRGMKGCYVYCTDEKLRDHLKTMSSKKL